MTTPATEHHAVQIAPATVRLERLLPGPAERIWSYLVDGDLRRQWFCGGHTLPGSGEATIVFQHSNITDEPTPEPYSEMDRGGIAATVQVVEFDPPRVLSITWPNGDHDSVVRFELFPENGKVLLVVTHRRLKDMAEQIDVSGGWHAHLDALEDVLAGRKPRGFWAKVARLEGEYAARFGL
ncbi:MAG: SRPBCC family protein [Rhizobiaceae bacterium]|nr:SRPBCC family protein [Rhizobiaceae bacterium]